MRDEAPRADGTLAKADMHVHTLYSDGTASIADVLDHVEHATDLDLIAITDHERIDGALRARELHAAGDFSFGLVIGEELRLRDISAPAPVLIGSPLLTRRYALALRTLGCDSRSLATRLPGVRK